MEHKFGYIPVHSQFIDTEEALTKIVGKYFLAFEQMNGIRLDDKSIKNEWPLVYLVVTGGTEQLLLNIIEKRKTNQSLEPVLLIAHPTHNSLPASLETLARLQQENIPGEIFYLSSEDDEQGLYKIKDVVENICVRNELRSSKIGLIGEPSDWLVASSPKPAIVKTTWGTEVVPIDIDEIKKSLEDITSDDIFEMYNSLKSGAGEVVEPSKLDLENNVKVYLALKKIIDVYKLNALTIRCFDLVLDKKTTGCFGLAQLNDEGYIAGCEGDLVSTIGMLWTHKLLKQIPWMANPAQLDKEKNTLWLAHCTVPRSLVNNYTLRSHFESGLGVGIQGNFDNGPVTLLRLGGRQIEKIWLAEGEIIQTGNSEHLCRTQIEIQLSKGNVKELLTSPLGNHIILVSGHHAERLKNFWKMLIIKQ